MNPVPRPAFPLHGIRIPSRFGPVSLVWAETETGPEVQWIALPGEVRPETVPGTRTGNPEIAVLARDIGDALSGKPV